MKTAAGDVRVDLTAVLPEAADGHDACVARLTSGLLEREGIESVHVLPAIGESPAQVCIHYQPEVIGLRRIRELTSALGTRLTDEIGHISLDTHGIDRPARARVIEGRLRELDGVLEAHVAPTGALSAEFDRKRTSEPVTLVTGWALNSFTPIDSAVPTALFISAHYFGGWYTVKEAFETVRAGRFEIDFLMLIAAAGAAVLGELAEGALLLALFSIGHALEGYAMGRARNAIEALPELAPETALTRRDGVETPVSVGQLVVGDLVIVKPNQRLAADGYVVLGTGSVDQAAVTGESVPVDKRPVSGESWDRRDPHPCNDLRPPGHRCRRRRPRVVDVASRRHRPEAAGSAREGMAGSTTGRGAYARARGHSRLTLLAARTVRMSQHRRRSEAPRPRTLTG